MDLSAFEANYQPFDIGPVAQPQKKKKNFLESLLPSIGGTGGAVGGAALGSALLPGVGTLAGALLGGALGGGGGKVAENALEHQNLGSGVLGQATLSGVLGAGPLRLGRLGYEAATGLKGGASLADALTNAGNVAANQSITRAAGEKLGNSGTRLIAKEFRLTPTQQNNFKNLHGEEATQVLRRFGIKKPEDVSTQIQPLQDAFNNIVHQIPSISKNELQTGLKSVYQPLLDSPALFEQSLGQQVKKQADELLKQAKGGNISADAVNGLRQTFDNAVHYTERGAPEYNVIKKTADALRTTLQKQADKSGVKFGNQTFKQVGQELNKLHGLNDIIAKQSYNGTGSLPASLPNLLGIAAGGATGGPVGGALGLAGTMALNSATGRRAITSGAIKAGEKLAQRGANNTSKAFGIKQVGKRVGGVGLADALYNQSSGLRNNQPNTMSAANNINQPSAANISGLSQNSQDLSSTQNVGTNQSQAPQYSLSDALTDIQRDPKNADEYMKLYQFVQDATATQAPKLNSTQQQQANNAVSGLQDLQTLSNMIQQDPGVLVKDILPTSLGHRLTGTTNYEAAKQNVVDVIARLRSGAAITEDEAKRYMSLLPQAGDSVRAANQKLSRLADLLGGFANPQPAGSSLSDVLGQLQ